MRVTGSSSFLLILVSVVAAGCSPGVLPPAIVLQANPGEAPGIVMDSFPPGRDLGDTSTVVTVSSQGGFSGGVYLGVACCRDVMRQRTAPLAPGLVWSWQGTPGNYVTVANMSPGNARLNLNLSGYGSSLNNQPTVRYGKYLMTVTGTAQGASHTDETTVAITVLPEIGFTWFCVNGPANATPHLPVDPADESSRVVIDALIRREEQNPRPDTIHIAVFSAGRPDGVRLSISEEPGFSEDSARVRLVNSVTFEKQVATGCVSQRRTLQVQGGQTGQMVIRRSTDRSLVLRKPECNWTAGICFSTTWVDVVSFADEGFWDAFGGKSLTFTWLFD